MLTQCTNKTEMFYYVDNAILIITETLGLDLPCQYLPFLSTGAVFIGGIIIVTHLADKLSDRL